MPKIIKPRTLGFLSKTERLKVGASYIVTALGMFDLARPDERRFETEQALWLMAAKALPKGAVLDAATPKSWAELLVGGAARPVGGPASAMLVEWTVGPIHKRLVVSGDRNWRVVGSGAVATEPKPFTEMPIGPEQAFGGTGHADNPKGKGFGALDKIRAGELAPLPNVELADQLVRGLADQPDPALVGPIDLASKKRQRYAGTYDSHWLKNIAPAMPEDVDPRFFLSAPEDQVFPGYLAGGEPYHLRGFSGDEPELRGALPAFRVRCFLARKGEKDGDGELVEIAMRTDTLWLVAGARRGVLIYRGAMPVQDIDAEDISETMLAYERAADEPRSFAHYLEVWNLRRDRKTAFKYAFAESQLAPPLAQEVLARRSEERAAQARERLDKHYAAGEWFKNRQLEKAGVPEALRPGPSPHDEEFEEALSGLPLPTAEELEEGEVDLAGALDGIKALEKKMQEKVEKLTADAKAVQDSFVAMRAPGAEPGSVDALFAALDGLTGGSAASALDAGVAQIEAPTPSAGAAPTGEGAAEDALNRTKNWRETLLKGLGAPELDEEAEFAAARARFLDLPDGRPFAAARSAMESARSQELTFPAPAESAIGSGEQPALGTDLEALLDSLETAQQNGPDEAASKLAEASPKETLAKVNTRLAEALPNLPKDAGSPIEALLAALQEPGGGETKPEDPQQGAQSAAALAKSKLDAVADSLEEKEAKAMEAMAQMRRSLPEPAYPQTPLTASVAQRFGALVVAEFRNGLSLRGRDLAGANLEGADLTGGDLEGALLERANLTGARLVGARLANSALTGAVLDGADLTDVDLTKANLCKCSARGADFTRARFISAMLIEADFAESKFHNAQFEGLQFLKGGFDQADFSGAKLSKTNVLQTSLEETIWDGADLEAMAFMDLGLAGARFRGARLFRCAFLRVRAPNADFEAADITRSSFMGDVDLTGARFIGATGAESTFHEVQLAGASFDRGIFNRATFIKADATNGSFRLAALKGAMLGGAKLVGADFIGANLLKAQLRRADMSGAKLIGANLYSANLDQTILTTADMTGVNFAKTFLAVDSHVA